MGTHEGRFIRKSLNTTSWERGVAIIRETSGPIGETVDIEEACRFFIEDCESRNLSPETIGKYRRLVKELMGRFGKRGVATIAWEDLHEYRKSWSLGPLSTRKKLERLRTFFRFCVERGWARKNPALALKPPSEKPKPTLPFSKEEMEKIAWATELYPETGIYKGSNRLRIRTFMNLLTFSGLRIRDAVTLKKSAIVQGRLFLYTQKTGSPVYVPLPDWLVEDLAKVALNDTYYFWSGNGTPKSEASCWQRSLKRLFGLAGIKGHAHKFRDTFAVNLLLSGVPIEEVSVLLGHTSQRTTEKHYAPWVKARQVKLESMVKKSWKLTEARKKK